MVSKLEELRGDALDGQYKDHTLLTTDGSVYLESMKIPVQKLVDAVLAYIEAPTKRECPYCQCTSVHESGRCTDSGCDKAQQGAFVLPPISCGILSGRDIRGMLDTLGYPTDTLDAWQTRMTDLLKPSRLGKEPIQWLFKWITLARDHSAIGYEKGWLAPESGAYQQDLKQAWWMGCQSVLGQFNNQGLLAAAAMDANWSAFLVDVQVAPNALIDHLNPAIGWEDKERDEWFDTWFDDEVVTRTAERTADVVRRMAFAVARGYVGADKPTALPATQEWNARSQSLYLEAFTSAVAQYLTPEGVLDHRALVDDLQGGWRFDSSKAAGLLIAYARAGGKIDGSQQILDDWQPYSETGDDLTHDLVTLGYPMLTCERAMEVLERAMLPCEVYAEWPEYAE